MRNLESFLFDCYVSGEKQLILAHKNIFEVYVNRNYFRCVFAHIESRAVCRPHILLEDPLDEPSKLGFCPDVLGFGDSVNFERPLQVSCRQKSPRMYALECQKQTSSAAIGQVL